MQAAAMNPIALNEDGVDASIIEKEIEIAKDQLRAEGKPEAMLDHIAKGKIKRFFKDNTLVNQAFIKVYTPSKTPMECLLVLSSCPSPPF